MSEQMIKNALISDCGQYRLWLSRRWQTGAESLAFVMLNPSTADHRQDDPTIRRCMGFARREGYGGIVVFNLYSFRATKPSDMFSAADPVGPETDDCLRAATSLFDRMVCAWGANAKAERVAKVVDLLAPRTELLCLGTTKAGHPRHPLYVKGDQPLVPWSRPTHNGGESDG